MVSNLAASVSAFTSNVFLVSGARTVLVDTGANFDVVGPIRERVDGLDAVLLTHTHSDHVGNVPAVAEAFDVDVWGFDPKQSEVDRALADGETVRIGDDDYRVLHTPGHKDDHVCFYSDETGILFAGDLVFANGGFGRTDLEEGDRATIVESLDRVLETIGEDLAAMHTGHGPSVTNEPFTHVRLARQMAGSA